MQTLFEPEYVETTVATCSGCGAPLCSVEINLTNGTARCPCGATGPAGDVIPLDFDFAHPPEGASFLTTPDGFVASATTRHSWAWLLTLGIAAWFVLELGGGLDEEGGRAGIGNLRWHLFLACAAVGLYPIALRFCSQFAMAIGGHVVVTRKGRELKVFEGLGRTGRTHTFEWSNIESLVEMNAPTPVIGNPHRQISLNLRGCSEEHVRFGTLLSYERRWFLLAVLRSQLAKWP